MIADLVVELHEALAQAQIAHAFGGALALVQYAEPRGTIDIDLNVATQFADADQLLTVLSDHSLFPSEPRDSWLPIAGVRFERSGELITLDVFFAFDAYHIEVLANATSRPFASSTGTAMLPFLSADDLVVMKLSFNRPKDWVDVEAMAAAGTPFDVDYVTDRLVRFRGPTMYPRAARFRRLAEGQSTLG